MPQLQERTSGRPRGLSRRQRAFIREKVLGLNDKDAALAAGYSLSVAENTKQKIWAKPQVSTEFERLLETILNVAMSAKPRK
jgi:phage terminase small subunit